MANFASKTTSECEVVELFEQLAALTATGMPLPSGLRAASQELGSRRLRSIFRDLASRLEAGDSLQTAMASSPVRFPPHIQGLVLAGARSGQLTAILAEYVRHTNSAQELRVKFWTSLTYPLLGLVLSSILVSFICSLSVRTYESLMEGFGTFDVKVERHVDVLIMFARFVDDFGLKILISMIVALTLFWLMIKIVASPARIRRWICSVPVLGSLLRLSAVTEFCHLMAMFLEAGTPLPTALELAGESVRDPDLARSCSEMSRAVVEGQPLWIAVNLWPGIPAGLGQLFRWSEDQRGLPDSLRIAGDMFETRARAQASFANNVLGVVLLLIILWWVGFGIAALYLPMINVVRVLSSLN